MCARGRWPARPCSRADVLLIRLAEAADGPVDGDLGALTRPGEGQATASGPGSRRPGSCPTAPRLAVPAGGADLEAAAASRRQTREPASTADLRNTVEAGVAGIAEAPDDVRTPAVGGHNPASGSWLHELDDAGATRRPARLDAGFPTGGVAVFGLREPYAERHRARRR